jgi:hypothetical protein
MRWSAQIHACFPVAGVTWDVPKGNRISLTYGTITLYGRPFQTALLARTLKVARLLRFRSPLLSESRLISVPLAT